MAMIDSPSLDDLRQEMPAELSGLASILGDEWETAKKLRYEQELIWIEDLRMYRGIYDPEIAGGMHPKRSKAFIRTARAKVKAWTSRAHKILFPAGDDNFDVESTPVPELDRQKHQAIIVQAVQQAIMTGQIPPDPMTGGPSPQIIEQWIEANQPLILEAVKQIASQAALGMKQQIRDQLIEGGFSKVARSVMASGHIYGTGVLKGPMHEVTSEERWEYEPGEGMTEGTYSLEQRIVSRPHFTQRPIWSIYPDPYATTIEEAEYLWDRHVLNAAELEALSRRAGFRTDIIRAYLQQHKGGENLALEPWESQLRELNAGKVQVGNWQNRFQVLERWGTLFGHQMAAAGVAVPDEQMSDVFMVSVFMLGGMIIRVKRFPLRQRLPFHFYYYDKDETSLWGEGIPRVGRDPFRLFNASVRGAADNMAMSAGPQIEVNADLLENEQDPTDIRPFRVWQRKGRSPDAQYPAVRVYQVESHVDKFMGLAAQFREMSDEATAAPSYTYGVQDRGLTKTVGGLSMLMGQSNITLEDSAKSWDEGITVPFIAGLYDYNMVYSDRADIKGDFAVAAIGATSLMAKELRSRAIGEFRMSTANPLDAPFTNRVWLLQEHAKALDLDPNKAVPNAEQIQVNAQVMGQAGGMQPAPGPAQGPMPGQPAAIENEGMSPQQQAGGM